MKKIIIVIAFYVPFFSTGQVIVPNPVYDSTMGFGIRYDSLPLPAKPDTIPCLMLVCDTSSHYIKYKSGVAYTLPPIQLYDSCLSIDNKVYWRKGYYIDWSYPPVYLDENKKALPNSIIVWMSKYLNK